MFDTHLIPSLQNRWYEIWPTLAHANYSHCFTFGDNKLNFRLAIFFLFNKLVHNKNYFSYFKETDMTPKEIVAKNYECFNTGDMETFVFPLS